MSKIKLLFLSTVATNVISIVSALAYNLLKSSLYSGIPDALFMKRYDFMHTAMNVTYVVLWISGLLTLIQIVVFFGIIINRRRQNDEPLRRSGYEWKCPKHGKVVSRVSGYPPFEHLHCPVQGCNCWTYVK